MHEEVSLYRKYRPQNFEDLVGQNHIRQTLLHALRKRHLAHAYLFCGPRGTGKTTTARLVAKGLNCLKIQNNAEPCNHCDICIDITNGRLIDILEIDAASNRGIDEIRDLREKIKFAPTRAAKKVYIIDEVHMLTKEAFNALLKTLEEPPTHAHFILATTEIFKVPETIISRCQRFDFKRIDIPTTVQRLQHIAQKEDIYVDEKALHLIAKHAEGGLRDAIGLMEQLTLSQELNFDHVRECLGVSGEKSVREFFELLMNREVTKALHYLNQSYQEGVDLTQFHKECLEYLRETLLEAVAHDADEEVATLLEWINVFQEAQEHLKSSAIPQLPLEMAVIKICFGERRQRSVREKVVAPEIPIPVVPVLDKDIPEREHKSLEAPKFLELNEESLKQHWIRLLDHIKTPSVKRSLTVARIVNVSDSGLLLGLSSQFHRENLERVQAKEEVERALELLFGKRLTVQFQTMDIQLDAQSLESLEQHDDAQKSDDFAQKAVELFGGEFIE